MTLPRGAKRAIITCALANGPVEKSNQWPKSQPPRDDDEMLRAERANQMANRAPDASLDQTAIPLAKLYAGRRTTVRELTNLANRS